VCGMVEPELSHPKWNGFKKALKASGLEYSALKLTIACNYNHGSFQSGDKQHVKCDALRAYLSSQPPEYYAEQAEQIAFDRCQSVDAAMAKASLEDWMETPLIKNRGRFAAALALYLRTLLDTTANILISRKHLPNSAQRVLHQTCCAVSSSSVRANLRAPR
jgi:hypothetical protein